jgi:tetratricopeptide (TPR) repeat protein
LITGCANDLATNSLNSGVEKYEQGDYQGAMDDWSKAIEIDPRQTLAYYNRGNAKYF